MLRLNMPNIILMDLVVSFFSSYLIRLTYNSHAVPMLLFSFHTHASCTPHLIHLHAVHGYVPFSFSSILPLPCSRLMFYFSSISWLCLMHAPKHMLPHTQSMLGLIGGSNTNMYILCRSSIKGRKCQPENSSLVLLVFPHSQPERSPPQLTASAFGASPSVFDSLECQLTLSPLGCFTRTRLLLFTLPNHFTDVDLHGTTSMQSQTLYLNE